MASGRATGRVRPAGPNAAKASSRKRSATGSKESRIERRWEVNALCRLASHVSDTVGRMTNISASGIKLECTSGFVPRIKDRVILEWPDKSLSPALVVWVGGRTLGLRFVHLVPDFRDRADAANLGSESFGRLVRLQLSLQRQSDS